VNTLRVVGYGFKSMQNFDSLDELIRNHPKRRYNTWDVGCYILHPSICLVKFDPLEHQDADAALQSITSNCRTSAMLTDLGDGYGWVSCEYKGYKMKIYPRLAHVLKGAAAKSSWAMPEKGRGLHNRHVSLQKLVDYLGGLVQQDDSEEEDNEEEERGFLSGLRMEVRVQSTTVGRAKQIVRDAALLSLPNILHNELGINLKLVTVNEYYQNLMEKWNRAAEIGLWQLTNAADVTTLRKLILIDVMNSIGFNPGRWQPTTRRDEAWWIEGQQNEIATRVTVRPVAWEEMNIRFLRLRASKLLRCQFCDGARLHKVGSPAMGRFRVMCASPTCGRRIEGEDVRRWLDRLGNQAANPHLKCGNI
jgi:hypothetical protein